MKLAEIVEKSDKELEQLISERRGRLADLQIEMRTKKVTNIKEIQTVKKAIAQALTIARQREISRLENTQ